jgi:1,4-dihydroxy-2-naphthoate octaprenyltransferase
MLFLAPSQLFRPDRDGKLDLVDFVKSIDAIYKRYRLLLASIANTNAIDRASERIFNFAYYILVIVIVTMAWGFDPISIFLSLSSIVLAFAFMIGKASASYFDGVRTLWL